MHSFFAVRAAFLHIAKSFCTPSENPITLESSRQWRCDVRNKCHHLHVKTCFITSCAISNSNYTIENILDRTDLSLSARNHKNKICGRFVENRTKSLITSNSQHGFYIWFCGAHITHSITQRDDAWLNFDIKEKSPIG